MKELSEFNRKAKAERELRMHRNVDKSYTPKDWDDRRGYVLSRDGNKCRKCGGKSGLQVHHIVPRSQKINHHVDNLITLCVYCHSKEHNVNFVPAAIERKIRFNQKYGRRVKFKKRKSRKEHKCDVCYCVIPKGTFYYFAQYGRSSRYKQEKLCESCFLTK